MRMLVARRGRHLTTTLLILGTLGVIWADTIEANNAPACQYLICAASTQCGSWQWAGVDRLYGVLNVCSKDENGNACTYCDGQQNIRVCAGAGQSARNCTLAANKTTCGKGWNGTCTFYDGTLLHYYYCKQGANRNNNACQSPQECTGDVACPAG